MERTDNQTSFSSHGKVARVQQNDLVNGAHREKRTNTYNWTLFRTRFQMRNGSTLRLLQLLPRLYLRCMLQRPSESESAPARRTPPPPSPPPYVVSVCRGRGGEVIPRFNRLTLSTELFHAWQSLIQFIIFKYMAK